MGDSRFPFAMPNGKDAIVAIEKVFSSSGLRGPTPEGMTALVPFEPDDREYAAAEQ